MDSQKRLSLSFAKLLNGYNAATIWQSRAMNKGFLFFDLLRIAYVTDEQGQFWPECSLLFEQRFQITCDSTGCEALRFEP